MLPGEHPPPAVPQPHPRLSTPFPGPAWLWHLGVSTR